MRDTGEIATAIGITIFIAIIFFAASAIIAIAVPLAVFAGVVFLVHVVLTEGNKRN